MIHRWVSMASNTPDLVAMLCGSVDQHGGRVHAICHRWIQPPEINIKHKGGIFEGVGEFVMFCGLPTEEAQRAIEKESNEWLGIGGLQFGVGREQS